MRVYPTEEQENEQGAKGMLSTQGRRQGGRRAPLPLALPLDTNSQGCPKRCRANLNVRVSLSRVRARGLPASPRTGNEVERRHQFPRPRLTLRDARFSRNVNHTFHQIPIGKSAAQSGRKHRWIYMLSCAENALDDSKQCLFSMKMLKRLWIPGDINCKKTESIKLSFKINWSIFLMHVLHFKIIYSMLIVVS